MSDTETTDRERLNSSESSADDSSESSRSKKTQEARDDEYDVRLTNDLERLLRYASTAKDIDVPKDVLEEATKALQVAKSSISERNTLDQQAELALFKSIDALSPKVYPATAVSLEIAEVMDWFIARYTETARDTNASKKSHWCLESVCLRSIGFCVCSGGLKSRRSPRDPDCKVNCKRKLNYFKHRSGCTERC
ncbi:hypothetical protein PQR71_07630 [Paraburkholderia fungorum]|uniref:hypothetical protein n=1 Tax=Paraburkholderia fungorum TaxID=134537 RepID=UPI0038BB032F